MSEPTRQDVIEAYMEKKQEELRIRSHENRLNIPSWTMNAMLQTIRLAFADGYDAAKGKT